MILLTTALLAQVQYFEIKTNAKVGDVFELRAQTYMEGEGGTLETVSSVKERLLSHKGGRFTWLSTNQMESMNGTGSFSTGKPDLEPFDATFVRDAQERIISARISGMDFGPKLFEDSSTMSFPEGKIKIGHSWRQKMSVSGVQATLEYTFLGTETFQGIPSYKFQFALLKNPGLRTTSTGLMYYDMKTCRALYGKGAYVLTAGGQEMSVRFVLKRVKGPEGVQVK